MKRSLSTWPLNLIFGVLMISMLALAGRLWMLLREGQARAIQAAEKQERISIPVPGRPGSIYMRARDGVALLAGSKQSPFCYADPVFLRDDELGDVSVKVADALALDARQVQEVLFRRRDMESKYVVLKRGLTQKEEAAILALKLPMIGIGHEWKREYPSGELAATVVGFRTFDEEPGRGLRPGGGIELSQNAHLASMDGLRVVEADARRRAIWPVDEESRPPKDGGHVFLTLDATIQGYLDKAVRSAFETHKGKWATGIVIDPNTGTILAMCSYPNFDPNTFNTSSPDSRLCRAIAVPYEPGSAMKGVFAAAVVDAGLMTFDTKIDCMNGSYSAPNGGTVTDHGGPYGVMPLTDVVVHSKNVGMAKVGEKMGNPALYETARRFGFGQETGIELPGESCGIVRDLRKMDGYSLRRIPFGQEISVTGLQLAMAYGALVNGGTLYRPRLIDHITDATGNVQFQSKPTALRQVISPRTSQGILSVLQQVVERGTGKACQMDKWTSGGKTGTAQIAVGGVYPAGAFTSTFIGVAPASKQPALVCLISVYWPHSGHFGAQVAAPYVKEVLEQTLPYLNVPPDKTEPVVAGAGRAAP